MSLKDKISDDLKTSMKARDAVRTGVIRMSIAAIVNKQIELGHELSDEDVISVLTTEAKKRRDAAEQFRNGARNELADKEEAEFAILKEYLPEQMGEDEIRVIVKDVIATAGAESMKDLGAVMKQLMPKIKGKADGALVNKIVRSELS
ncbi:Transamidase GatB domain protein [hydrothermal vent metagenome]|uniref:Transamidase GatB domain protein n=1 Tax=hydrothermal vent metagenome TaxID=652676 RepID=A0A3B1CSD0_9ZZZZ